MLTAVKKDGTPFSLLPRLPKEKLKEDKRRSGDFNAQNAKKK